MKHTRRRFERRTSPWGSSGRVPALWGAVTRRVEKAAYDAVDAATARRTAMIAAAAERRGTRKRSIPMIAAGFVGLGAMFGAVSQNALAVNFTTTNNSFKLYSNYLQGEKAAGFLARNTSQNGTNEGVAELGIVTAKLAGLCAIATQDMGLLGTVSLMIIAGDPVAASFTGTGVPAGVDVSASGTTAGQLQNASLTNAITASNLFVNSNALSGYGNLISGLNLGQSADTVHASAGLTWPSGQSAPTAGGFGLYANRLNVAGLDTQTYGINLEGQITLPRLKLQVLRGAKTQADCPTQAAS